MAGFWEWAVRVQYVPAVLGAAILFASMAAKGNPSFITSLIRILSPRDWSDRRITFIDLVITTIVGAYIAVLVAEPKTAKEAFTAGLGWVGLINGIPSGRRRRR
ncbi:MAG TPA: hypothetical protein VGR25_08020 [bacterium]|nr:hypothetical protein [bacterium]